VDLGPLRSIEVPELSTVRVAAILCPECLEERRRHQCVTHTINGIHITPATPLSNGIGYIINERDLILPCSTNHTFSGRIYYANSSSIRKRVPTTLFILPVLVSMII